MAQQGNAFVLLGYAKQYAKQLGLEAKTIREEMTAGDYENLIKVFDNCFRCWMCNCRNNSIITVYTLETL